MTAIIELLLPVIGVFLFSAIVLLPYAAFKLIRKLIRGK